MNSQKDTLPSVRPTEGFNLKNGAKYKQLDMRVANLFGADLHKLICQSVESTQVLHGIDLPDRLVLSHRQFISVEPNTQMMDATVDRLYVTPLNVMEVEIDQNYQHVDDAALDILIGYEEGDENDKRQAKGIILHED